MKPNDPRLALSLGVFILVIAAFTAGMAFCRYDIGTSDYSTVKVGIYSGIAVAGLAFAVVRGIWTTGEKRP